MGWYVVHSVYIAGYLNKPVDKFPRIEQGGGGELGGNQGTIRGQLSKRRMREKEKGRKGKERNYGKAK